MADQFTITPPVVRAEGKDVPPEQIQAGFNSLARQTQLGLNSVASDPSGPASGDLGGTYPAPSVVAVHAVGGTLDGVVIGGTTPSTGAFTTLTASTPVAVTSGGTGRNALTANAVVIGEGSSQVNFAAPGVAGTLLASNGAAADPSFQTQASLGIAPLANPAFTGTPTAPTAAAHTNTTQLATTAFVETEFASPPTAGVGSVTPSPGAFTTLSASSTVSGTGFTNRFASPGPIGNTAASTGAFTTLSASSTVSGTGFTTFFASPPPVGSTAASTGAFTTLNASGNDALEYTNTSGQSIPNSANTIVTSWTLGTDRLGTNFNASTGVFTAPATGIYQVSAQLVYAANASAAGTAFEAIVFANGVQISQGVYIKQAAASVQCSVVVTAICSITSGQTITLQAFQNSGGAILLNTVAAQCWLCINRLP